MSTSEAKTFVDAYFAQFPRVRGLPRRHPRRGATHEREVTTIFGRVRPDPRHRRVQRRRARQRRAHGVERPVPGVGRRHHQDRDDPARRRPARRPDWRRGWSSRSTTSWSSRRPRRRCPRSSGLVCEVMESAARAEGATRGGCRLRARTGSKRSAQAARVGIRGRVPASDPLSQQPMTRDPTTGCFAAATSGRASTAAHPRVVITSPQFHATDEPSLARRGTARRDSVRPRLAGHPAADLATGAASRRRPPPPPRRPAAACAGLPCRAVTPSRVCGSVDAVDRPDREAAPRQPLRQHAVMFRRPFRPSSSFADAALSDRRSSRRCTSIRPARC